MTDTISVPDTLLEPASGPRAPRRVVIITPGPRAGDWINTVVDGLKKAGLRPVFASDGDIYSHAERSVLVTEDAAWLMASGVEEAAIIQSAAGSAADLYLRASGGALRDSLCAVSLSLSQACVERPAQRRWIRGFALPSGEVELFASVTVTVPSNPEPAPENPDAASALAMFEHGPPEVGVEAEWRPSVFVYDMRGAETRATISEMDATGRARNLVYGPYISLPPGLWRATLGFSCDQSASRHMLRFEWGTPENFQGFYVTPKRSGRYEVVLEHRWTKAEPAELRMILTESSLGGQIGFDGVKLLRLD